MLKFLALCLLVTLILAGCGKHASTSPASETPELTSNPSSSPSVIYTPIPSPTASTSISTTNPSWLNFSGQGYTEYGNWTAQASADTVRWQPGQLINLSTSITLTDSYLTGVKSATNVNPDGVCLLVTAERTFDSKGILRLGSDEKMSTLLTPTGLAIEGGIPGAVTNRFGYGFRTPVDEFKTSLMPPPVNGQRSISFKISTRLPADLPMGIYRLRLDYGLTVKNRYYSLNAEAFAKRPFFKGKPTQSFIYSPPIRADGKDAAGQSTSAANVQTRVPWIILANYNSNGYRGVVADEDKPNFAMSSRNIIPDEVILPLYAGSTKNKVSYSLEPQFPADTIEEAANIPWNYNSGELSIKVTNPDGTVTDLGTFPFVGKTGQWPTTKKTAFTAWRPPGYGYYTVKATGWIDDIWGNRYSSGGTYHFWIANRMTLATATFQGQAYPVGGRYGRDLGFAPAVPADVEVTATLYPDSDPTKARSISYSGKASPSGIFGSAQGSKPLPLDAPGEYIGHILAKYTDQEGNLWICSMTHAGVVYSEDSSIVARGKKLKSFNYLVDRGNTYLEGYVEPDGTSYLQHINYPFVAGDVLLIASDQQGADKIEPVLTYENKTNPKPYDPVLQNIGATNLQLKTSNGYSPHMFPEYITDWAYYYAGAPRPGFMSRFLVGEDGVRAPYWPTSPNSFGGQINASNNGDLPGDIYRLIGGVVVRKKGETPAYAGYMASGFILPRGTNNNRVIAAGSEDLTGSTGEKARFFLTGTRPGMTYETGTLFTPAVQIDPILPATVTFTLQYPDGRKVTTQGIGDSFGSFAGKDRWLMDIPGVYKFYLSGEWQGHIGYMPGLPATGGEIYVIEKDKPAGATELKLDLPVLSSFAAAGTLTVNGITTASEVRYAAVIPGAVIAQGTIPVTNGRFTYNFNPAVIREVVPTYDTVNLVTGKAEIGDVVQLTFFTRETSPSGTINHSFARLLLRGTSVIYVR